MSGKGEGRRFRFVHLLLFLPFLALVWVPYYNRTDPALAGIPFFYWYQLLWIVIGAILIGLVYVLTERRAL